MANNRAGEVLVHLGSSNYLDRYKIYVTHVRDWQQQFDKLESVDLRYDRQIIVNPDLQGTAKQPPLSAAAAKKAMAAGVKPAALITRITSAPKPSPAFTVKPVETSKVKPIPVKTTNVKVTKARHHKPNVRQARALAKSKAKAKIATIQKPDSEQKSVAAAPAKPGAGIAKGEEPQ